MNMKILLISLLFLSCEKEAVTKEAETCNCYEYHEKIDGVAVNGLIQLVWVHDYSTTPAPELCEKETGKWIDNGTGRRYKVNCN